ncbi:hypothetical protein Slala04_27360 [Streptomyces lavendulae subsp. lavendulae]|uniref:hypothetical protein n=1 Tax=Streptomyces virginiae TaxID=1961 RepID=UPI0024A305AC|nr:hypothetical protein Slala04_27360 [Streptomyces lavendulae subsp. lavendulae]
MPESHDPLRSAFRAAASAGQSATSLPPVSAIEHRGELVRRRRIVGIAAACCLLLGGSGAALAAFLPQDSGRPTLPATTPSPVAPSDLPTSVPTSLPPSAPPSARSTTTALSPPSATAGVGGDPDPGRTMSPRPPQGTRYPGGATATGTATGSATGTATTTGTTTSQPTP